MITLEKEQAGRALGLGSLAQAVTGVSVDSRTLRPGDLFVALRGERHDGHDYLTAAFAAGASGAVVTKKAWPGAGTGTTLGRPAHAGPVYEVADTFEALGALARAVRRESGATVFAITGSVGKTSTKDILRAMLSRVWRVAGTEGNQNNEVGVPLTLLGIEPEIQAVVTEMGMRGRGQIAALAEVAEPDVGVITNVHPVHLELLGSIEQIAEAKAELVVGLRVGGTAVVPAYCPALERCLAGCSTRLVRFGVGEEQCEADVQGWLKGGEREAEPTLVLRWPGGGAQTATDWLPRHTLENAVAAAAACYAAGLPVEECVAGLADVELSGGRGQVVEAGGLCLIDDTYNANPVAVRAALDELAQLAARRKGRAVAVLGDMLELGPDQGRFHREAGRYAAQVGVRALWGVGPLATAMVEGFQEWWKDQGAAQAEWSAGQVESSETWSPVVSSLREGDVVLFKASRSVRLENVVRRVLEQARTDERVRGSSPADHGGQENGEAL
jgi:UDP-N-acetylmuramoyl-tripeptide--D-alanyl-D-alanine ligase